MSKNGTKELHCGKKWDKVANMINRFGLPIKDYYEPAHPVTRASYAEKVLAGALGSLRVVERLLMEKTSVPRRVSAFDR